MQAIGGGVKEGDTGKVARQQLSKVRKGKYTDCETHWIITAPIFVLRLLKSGSAGRPDARDAFL